MSWINLYMLMQQQMPQKILFLARNWKNHCWAPLKEDNLRVIVVAQVCQRAAQRKTSMSKVSLKVQLRHNLDSTYCIAASLYVKNISL